MTPLRAAFAAVFAGAVQATALIAPGRADDADVARFYHGRQVKMIIRTDPGGAYDSYARLLIRYIGRHIPGDPTFIPINMPGASGIQAANYVANIAPRDGSILTNVSFGFPIYQALGILPTLKTDMAKFNWIGSLNVSDQVLVTWKTSPTKTLEDAKRRVTDVAAAGAGSTGQQLPLAFNSLLGTRFKVIGGYDESSALDLAMERGGVEGRGANAWGDIRALTPQLVPNLNVIIQVGPAKEPDLPNVPLLTDLATSPAQRAVMQTITEGYVSIGKPFATSPGAPPERVAALRKAFDETMRDPDFLAEAHRERVDIRPVDGASLQKIVADIVNTPPDTLGRVKAAIGLTSKSSGQP
jgi:tripartite-type tricarboxylate transporter receptor subunit TctC